MKKILGYFILINVMPILIGLFTLNGKLCSYGNCEDVIPFWGGYLIGLAAMGIGAIILLIAHLVFKYLLD